jgi:uncharacterized protein (DUF885 family)
MNTTRRELLIAAAGTTLAAGCSVGRLPAEDPLDRLHAACLRESPHNATAYGLDVGAHAALRSRWPRRSRDEAGRLADGYAAALASLKAAAVPAGDAERRATLDAAAYSLERAVEGSRFAYGDQTLMATIDQENTPYPVNQMIGLAMSGPSLLATQQPLADDHDRQAFVARLAALAPAIDAETRWFRDDGARGVRPPRFILATMLAQLQGVLSIAPSAARPAAALPTDAVVALLAREVYPAIARQRDAVAEALPLARDDAGVRGLPDGEAYYAWALGVATSTSHTPREVHALGHERLRELNAAADALLRRQGLTEGGVGARLAALAADPAHRFAADDSGRAAAIAHCTAWLARCRAAMPRWSRLALRAPVEVQRVPVEREAGAAGAYMAPGPLDGSRPAVFYLNLRDPGSWPRWALPTLVAHETLPGHAWQEAHEVEQARRHPIRALLRYNGYSEGWALYAERLLDEADFYADDPLARLGYLQAQLLRAARLVVDTGLHAFGWSREQAVRTLAEATGRPLAAVQGEIDRYCVKPGQACGYEIGQIALLRLRDRWLQRPGADARDFNDAVLRAGNLPLSVLQRALDAA